VGLVAGMTDDQLQSLAIIILACAVFVLGMLGRR